MHIVMGVETTGTVVTNYGKCKGSRPYLLSLKVEYHLSLALKAIYPPFSVWHTPVAVTLAVRKLGRKITIPGQPGDISNTDSK